MNEDTLTFNILQLVYSYTEYGEIDNTQEIIDKVKLIKKELFSNDNTSDNHQDVPF